MNIKDSVNCLKGIGPKYTKLLEKLEILTIEDFLYYYPKSYQDRSQIKKISEAKDGEVISVHASIESINKENFGYRRKALKIIVNDESGKIEILFFNSPYLEKSLSRSAKYEFYGKVVKRLNRLQMIHPEYSIIDNCKKPNILPIYALTNGITQNNIRKWQGEASLYVKDINEYLPKEITARNRLCSLQYALENIHFPKDQKSSKEAAYRLIFDELFILQLGLLFVKNQIGTKAKGIKFSSHIKSYDFINGLPFRMTKAQKRVINEIESDMESSKTMNRLIQGDVGSGKTIVAAAAAYKAIKSGYQALLMAPTELLARQHYESLDKTFNELGIKTGLLTGSMTDKQRNKVLEDVREANIDFLIGTHALIQPGIQYGNVGLVITDEQHRFGVNQRKYLSLKGENPDVLVMTATPIPRTLAVVLYGDLDHSQIDEMPEGRKPVLTKVISTKNRSKAYKFIEEQVSQGRQAYIVAPLIEDSEHIDAKSAIQVYEESTVRFDKYNVKLLHGNMKQCEKDLIMEGFHRGEVDILVSTVIIEVGINVPNANVMLIENSERFGLSTLHQLRGRVGRGVHQSFCILINDSKNEIARERAKILKETNDGFIIAEKDLELRGPGEFFGTKQHGVPTLKIADLSKHFKILNTVRNEANDLLKDDPGLKHPKNKALKIKINEFLNNFNLINI